MLNDNAIVPSGASTDAALVELWLRTKRSANTRDAYARDVARLLGRGVPLGRLTLADLVDFAESLGDLAPASQKRAVAAVKSLLTFAQKTGAIPVNVGAALPLPRVPEALSQRIVDEEAVVRLLALETDPVRHLLLRLLYAGGLRVSELCGLRWAHAQARKTAGQITVTGKGDKARVIVLRAETWKALQAIRPPLIDPSAPIFATRSGKALDRQVVHRIVKAAAARAGLPEHFSSHWLRHAHASHALERGASIALVKETLGHTSIATTGRYLHARPDESSARYLPA